ncbi:MAG: NgoMIV family type II restriction endonuclease [Firmicutes bacterium]|nr:NgoMIV family type II restriction endonuclease [Bacillota bacterium]
MTSIIAEARQQYHTELIRAGVLGLRAGNPSFADVGSKTSLDIAQRLAKVLAIHTGMTLEKTEMSGQTLGKKFTDITMQFVQRCFDKLDGVRPGPWRYETEQGISRFVQYRHLAHLAELAESNPDLRSLLGSDYVVKPDIVISRLRLKDEAFGSGVISEEDRVAMATPLREQNSGKPGSPDPILHASISCKWTMRSDRAQNTRTEALNLIRHRKGKVPIIVAVTAEPMPTRLASLALGTGDIDRVYHFALYELQEAVRESEKDDQCEMLNELIHGERLSDISDLPFDLAI